MYISSIRECPLRSELLGGFVRNHVLAPETAFSFRQDADERRSELESENIRELVKERSRAGERATTHSRDRESAREMERRCSP